MKNVRLSIIIGGTIAGFLMFITPGGVFMLLLAALSIFWIRRIRDREERSFVLKVYVAGLTLRIVLVIVSMFYCTFSGNLLNYHMLALPNYNAPYFLDDCGYYTLRSFFTALHWQGSPEVAFAEKCGYINQLYGANGFIYILASYFGLFGYSPISSKFINCLFGILTAILVYFLAKDICGRKAARMAMLLTAFFPSLLIWSITNLKESPFIFFVYLMLWAMVRSYKTKKAYYVFIALVSAGLQLFIRGSRNDLLYITVALIFSYYATLVLVGLIKKKRFILVVVMVAAAFILGWSARVRIVNFADTTVKRILVAHRGMVSEGGQVYKLIPDVYYDNPDRPITVADFSKMFLRGWVHILFEPFPWHIRSKSTFLSFPQMILWYVLLIFAVKGMALLLRYRCRESAFMFIYFVVITSVLALTGGNIGTVFRLRDMITPIVLIFASAGLVNAFYPPLWDTPGQDKT